MNLHSMIVGDAHEELSRMDCNTFQCCVTSPPYWGLRDYGVEGQIGKEESLDDFVKKLVEVFAQVNRVLTDSGTLWLNIGDCYTNAGGRGNSNNVQGNPEYARPFREKVQRPNMHRMPPGCKPKDLIMLPAIVALALRDWGWYLRSNIIWSKTSPMPESAKDRPTNSHESIFLFSKSQKYFCDVKRLDEPVAPTTRARLARGFKAKPDDQLSSLYSKYPPGHNSKIPDTRKVRNVWTLNSAITKENHFAAFPPEIPRRAILASTNEGDTVIDPFAGQGTTGAVAKALNRKFIGIEINDNYAEIARKKISQTVCQKTLPL